MKGLIEVFSPATDQDSIEEAVETLRKVVGSVLAPESKNLNRSSHNMSALGSVSRRTRVRLRFILLLNA